MIKKASFIPNVANQESAAFLEKKQQKTFVTLDHAGCAARGPNHQKFFASRRPDDRASARSESGRPEKLQKRTTYYLLTFSAVLLWGCAPVGTRYLVGDHHLGLPAVPFVALRYTLVLPAFLALLVWGRAWRWSRADWALGALCGLVGVTGYNLPNAMGTRTVSAGMIGLLNGAEPLMIILLLAVQRRRVPGAWTLAAAAVGLLGIVLLAKGAGPALGDAKGIALVLFAALAWSVYCVIVPPLLRRRGPMLVTAVTMTLGTLPMAAAGAAGMSGIVAHLNLPQWEILAALSSTAILAILCWNAGSAGLGAEQSGWFLYLLPVISLAGGVVFLHEPLTLVEFIGGGLIMVSVFISQKFRRSA